MDEIYYEEENYEPEYIPAKLLPEGWIWKKYDDGSGCLISPEKETFMDYDFTSNEYWFSKDKEYHFFPGRGFDRFEFMEKEILDRYINVKIEESKYIKIPEEDEMQIRPRSGISSTTLLDVKFGTVDNDWRGNSGIIVQNPTPFSYIIIPNSRLAQGVIVEKKRAVFDIKSSKDELSKTERGENGFGKSGLM